MNGLSVWGKGEPLIPNKEPVHRLMVGGNPAIILLKKAPSLKDARDVSQHSSRSNERNLRKLTAILDNTPTAMSKRLWMWIFFFCDDNQNLKAVFAVDHPSGPIRKQKFTSTGQSIGRYYTEFLLFFGLFFFVLFFYPRRSPTPTTHAI